MTKPNHSNATLSQGSETGPEASPAPPVLLAPTLSRALNFFLWPIAVVIIIHRTWILPQTDHPTDDFYPVWSAIQRFASGLPVYSENYLTTDPHYLYSPGGTLLLSPLSLWSSIDDARVFFALAQSAAIIAALILVLRWVDVPVKSPIVPGFIALAFLSEGVTSTIEFTNVNGSLLFALVLYLLLLTHRRNILAGLVIGIAITIKPVFLPLLFLPFVRKQFSSIAVAVAVVIATNLIGWQLMAQPRDYLEITVPYLGIVRDFFNTSLAGQLVWFGADPLLITMWRTFFAIFVIVGLVLALRWVDRDEKFWMATTAGLLLAGAFYISILGQQYYSIMLIPMVATLFRPLLGVRAESGELARTVMLNVPAGVATVFCFLHASWMLPDRDFFTHWFSMALGGFGWALFILTIAGVMIRLTIMDMQRGISVAAGYGWLRSWKPGATAKIEQHA